MTIIHFKDSDAAEIHHQDTNGLPSEAKLNSEAFDRNKDHAGCVNGLTDGVCDSGPLNGNGTLTKTATHRKLVSSSGDQHFKRFGHHWRLRRWQKHDPPRNNNFSGNREPSSLPKGNLAENQDERRIEDNLPIARRKCDAVSFPTIPISIEKPRSDTVVLSFFDLPSKRSTSASSEVLVCAAWALVLRQMTGSEDVLFGVAYPLENEPIHPKAIVTPLGLNTAVEQTLSEFLRSVERAMQFEKVAHAGLPHNSQSFHIAEHAREFQTVLAVHSSADSAEAELSKSLYNEYALVVELQLQNGTIKATFDQRVIEKPLVQKLSNRLRYISEQLCLAASAQMLSEVGMLLPSDLDQLWDWNHTVPPPVERCVDDIVEEQSRIRPRSLAVHAWDGELTYLKLFSLAAKLATHLIELGVGPDVFVPLCFEKSMWATVAMLGVLRAGGAFVMLDPSLPAQQLETIVRQVEAKLVISSPATRDLALRLSKEAITIDDGLLANLDKINVHRLPWNGPESTMYATFSSLNTDKPKGVATTHKSFASALIYQMSACGFTPRTRTYEFSTYSSDICIFNTFFTLAGGGCLCVPASQDAKNNVAGSMTAMGADTVSLTPSLARLLSPDQVPTLRKLLMRGEPITTRDAQPWLGRVELVPVYGTAECTPISMVNDEAKTTEDTLNLGCGSGCITWIVDPANHNALLPPGCVGELLLEGPLVSPRYLNDPEATASAFVDNPGWLIRGAPGRPGRRGRLYKTGDLVHYNDDGDVIFVGRKDTQLRINGQRVPLGEVEYHAHLGFPNASQVVAEIVTPKGSDAVPILALFQQSQKRDMDMDSEGASAVDLFQVPQDVTDMMAAHLSSFMIPTVLFSMEKLPMTRAGKMDRRKLREIGGSFSTDQFACARRQTTNNGCGK